MFASATMASKRGFFHLAWLFPLVERKTERKVNGSG